MRKTTEIRQAIGQVLKDMALFEKVYNFTKTNVDDKNLPCAMVSHGTGAYTNGASEVVIDVNIMIKAKGNEEVLDMLAEQVEELFPIGTTLNGLVEYMNPESFDYSIDHDSSLGVIGLNFNVKYEV